MEQKHTPGPCDICGCSLEVHGERMLCPSFFNGNFEGWQETHYYNSELLERVSSLTKERDEWKSKAIDLVNSIESQSQYKALTKEVEEITKRRNKAYAELDLEREKVESLTKENELLKEDFSMAVEDQLLPLQQQIKSLTEQVEKLKAEQEMQQKAMDWDRYKKNIAEHTVKRLETEAIRLRERHNKHGIAYAKLKKEFDEELSRLREEKKEMVEALRQLYEGTITMALKNKIESLLSKFEP